MGLRGSNVPCCGGSGDDAWPPSPPIQQVSIETIEGCNVALGVGCAGTSHWSLSVEPTADGFRFDWACRTKETPARLGTTYLIEKAEDQAAVRFAAEQGSVVSQSGGELQIVPAGELSGAQTYRWTYTIGPQ